MKIFPNNFNKMNVFDKATENAKNEEIKYNLQVLKKYYEKLTQKLDKKHK